MANAFRKDKASIDTYLFKKALLRTTFQAQIDIFLVHLVPDGGFMLVVYQTVGITWKKS